jgi:hypothetical protein
MHNTLNYSQLRALLAKTLDACMPLMVLGAPGIGKTDLHKQAARDANADCIVTHPVTREPTDAAGLPFADFEAGHAKLLPLDDLHRARTSRRKVLWVLDDFAQAPPAVQNSYAHLILAREGLPDHVVFAILANRRTDHAGSNTILSTIMSRCSSVVTLVPDVPSWVDWALGSRIHPAIVQHLRARPDHLYTEKPPMGEPFPTPRAWKEASNILHLRLDNAVEHICLEGCVGPGVAGELAATIKLHKEAIDCEKILADPRHSKLPTKPDALCAMATGLAYYAAPETISAICIMAERLYGVKQAEFSGLLLADVGKRHPRLKDTRAWMEMVQSDLGQAILGAGR